MSKKVWEKLWKSQDKSSGNLQKVIWYLRHKVSRGYSRRFAKILHGKVSPKILEIGCGSALTFKYVGKDIRDAELTGLDYSPSALKLAKKINPKCKFILGDAKALPFRAGIFDLTYSLGLIEHFSREVAQKIVNEHCRVTKKGGTVLIVVPAKYSPLNLVRIIMGKKWPYGFEDPFTREELETLLRKSGLVKIRIEKVNTIVLIGSGIKA
jgi:ubiquinone/menaquinone biosynthesis C-methylase UbiE